MFVFVITSSINSLTSVIDAETRYQDTFKTIESVRKKVPNSIIILSESSSVKLSDEKLKILSEKVDHLLVLSDKPEVKLLGTRFLQSPAEATNLILTLEYIKNLNLTGIDRVFKLTGRGQLNDNFDISHYEKSDLTGKYVFKKRIQSWMHHSLSLFSTRCWSFCYSLLSEVQDKMPKIYDGCMSSGHDLEHITFSEMDLNKLIEFEVVGFSCQISRTGEVEHD